MDGADLTREWGAALMQYLLTVAQQSARSLDLSYAVLRRVADGALGADAVRDVLVNAGDRYRERYAAEVTRVLEQFATDRQSALTTDCTRLDGDVRRSTDGRHVDLLTTLAELTAEIEQQCIGALLNRGRLTDTRALTLRGIIGERLSATVAVENTRGDAATLTCTLLDVRRADGGAPAFTADASVHITAPVLEPGQEADIEVAIHLDPVRFTPAHGYVTALRLIRDSEAPLDVPIAITPIESSTAFA